MLRWLLFLYLLLSNSTISNNTGWMMFKCCLNIDGCIILTPLSVIASHRKRRIKLINTGPYGRVIWLRNKDTSNAPLKQTFVKFLKCLLVHNDIQCPVYLFTFYHKNDFVHHHTVGFRPTGRVAVVKRSCCNDKQIMPPESDISY